MDQSRKLPIFDSLQEGTKRIAERNTHMNGRIMPASVVSVSGQIVTVNFEIKSDFALPQLQVPVFGSEYIRVPIQKGCLGFVISSDYYMGGISGLGAGVATLARQGNLSNLVFFPVGNKKWSEVDGDVLTLYGVSGVKITDKLGGSSSVVLSDSSVKLSNGSASATVSSDSISLNLGASSVDINSSGVSITGTLTINGEAYLSHTHSNGNEGKPTGGVI